MKQTASSTPLPPNGITPTGMRSSSELARLLGLGSVYLKLECERRFGNFKFLGGFAATVEALQRASAVGRPFPEVVCASDGNHGLAVAAGARAAGVPAKVYLPIQVDQRRVARIAAQGADVVIVGGTYDEAVTGARRYSFDTGALLVADTGEDPHDPLVHAVITGYQVLIAELGDQLHRQGEYPTHTFIQAGVGGLAAAVAEGLPLATGRPCALSVVEPATAACVALALEAGRPIGVSGSLDTAASMLSCGLASAAALKILKRHEVTSVLVDEHLLVEAVTLLRNEGIATTASGAAGLAGLLEVARSAPARQHHGLTTASRVLLIVTEGPIPASDA